jgi:hypothetical protein
MNKCKIILLIASTMFLATLSSIAQTPEFPENDKLRSEIENEIVRLEEARKRAELKCLEFAAQFYAEHGTPENNWQQRYQKASDFLEQEQAKGTSKKEIKSRLHWQSDMGKESAQEYWAWQKALKQMDSAINSLHDNNCYNKYNQVLANELCRKLQKDFEKSLLSVDIACEAYKNTPEFAIVNILRALSYVDDEIKQHSQQL